VIVPATPPRKTRAFALILTLVLLALLMLVVYGLSVLVNVGSRVAGAGTYQVQARQHALLGLNVALGELARHAAEPSRITGTAGMTGLAANAGNRTRQWAGVWASDGSHVAWLASGATSTTAVTGVEIELVATGSVGAPAANSEPVIAGKLPIFVPEVPGAPGVRTTVGYYAYLVSDEGVKLSAYAPGAAAAPQLFSTTGTSAAAKLANALTTHAAKLPAVLSYEQLALLPTPADALTPSVLQNNFHHMTLTHRFVTGTDDRLGLVNVNTNSVLVWRSLLQAYNDAPGTTVLIPPATVNSRGTAIVNALATYAGPGKSPAGPFRSVAAVGDFLATTFPSTGSPTAAQIMTVLAPQLTVRSDTFRLRAYGEALNPADPTKNEASALCEAIVQRGADGRFVTLSFRWLGPEDI
jgi:hypothetical protein